MFLLGLKTERRHEFFLILLLLKIRVALIVGACELSSSLYILPILLKVKSLSLKRSTKGISKR